MGAERKTTQWTTQEQRLNYLWSYKKSTKLLKLIVYYSLEAKTSIKYFRGAPFQWWKSFEIEGEESFSEGWGTHNSSATSNVSEGGTIFFDSRTCHQE